MRFMRHNNLKVSDQDRIGDRESCFESTLVHLTERFSGKEVFLVGSANKSTLLGLRTEKLIDHVKPDKVFVMTNEEWWKKASLLKYVRSQGEMNEYEDDLKKDVTTWVEGSHFSDLKKNIFKWRFAMYQALLKYHFKLDKRHRVWLPGFEMKAACEAAERNNS